MKFGLVSLELISILSSAIAFRAEDSRLNLVTPPIINRRWTRFSIWTRFPPSVRPNSGTVLSLLLSVYHPRGWGTFAGLGTGALAALGAAEEVIFRAYFFRLLSMATGTWIAVLVSSALFGAVHAANPGANLFSSLAIALEARVILAGAYAVTGRLWVPIGLHAGWNFAEGALFGMSVSGGPASAALSHGTLRGPTILTGGAFGPEASIAVLLCLAVGVILLWHTVRLGASHVEAWHDDCDDHGYWDLLEQMCVEDTTSKPIPRSGAFYSCAEYRVRDSAAPSSPRIAQNRVPLIVKVVVSFSVPVALKICAVPDPLKELRAALSVISEVPTIDAESFPVESKMKFFILSL